MAALLLLPQAPAWFAGDVAAAAHPVFNLDVAAAALLMLASRGAGLALLISAWAVDLSTSLARIYHFTSVQDLFRAAEFAAMPRLGEAVEWTQLLGLLAMAVCATVLWHVAGGAGKPGRLVVAGLAVVALITGADVVNGSAQTLNARDHVYMPVNVAGSPALNWAHFAWVEHLQAGVPLAPAPDAKAYRAVRSWAGANPGAGVLVVVVESLGLPRSPALSEWLQARVATARTLRHWAVAVDQEAFFGSTTYGELRVLCGKVGHYTRITESDGAQCLPRLYASATRAATGLHGFDLSFFDRRNWWPRVGLTPWSFEGRRSSPATGCNVSFPGVCDAELLREAIRLAQAPGAFVYALTLDTHLPLSGASTVDAGLAGLCRQASAGPTACMAVARLGAVLTALEAELASMSRRPLVVITGDHSPPFSDLASRDVFDAGHVPVYILTPLSAAPT